MGRSIGSGPALHLANAKKAHNLILLSPFDSISSILSSKLKFLKDSVGMGKKYNKFRWI